MMHLFYFFNKKQSKNPYILITCRISLSFPSNCHLFPLFVIQQMSQGNLNLFKRMYGMSILLCPFCGPNYRRTIESFPGFSNLTRAFRPTDDEEFGVQSEELSQPAANLLYSFLSVFLIGLPCCSRNSLK